jgi:hypothetical protein
MRTIVTAAPDEDIDSPDHPAGEDFQHVLLYGDGKAAFADDLGELIDLIIPGYGGLPDTPEGDEDALIQRHKHLADVANAVQSDYNAQAIQRGLLEPDTTDENILTATAHDRSEPWSGIYAVGSDSPRYAWDGPFPLVLIATDYAPYVEERPTPTGSVILLDPADEAKYLDSLTKLGLVSYMRRA